MAATGRVKAWKELLRKNITIPVAFDRQQSDAGKSLPFNLTIKSIDGVKHKNDVGAVDYQVRLTMFDLAYKQFFGRPWTSPCLHSKKSGQKIKIDVGQNAYFHTSLSDENIAVVVEILSTSTSKLGKMVQTSCGWSVLRVFSDTKMVDTSSNVNPKVQKLNVYQGTPAALAYMDENIENNPDLNTVSGCTIQCTIRTHEVLTKVMNLIDENCIVGNNDIIPGLHAGSRESKTSAPDPFKKPRLLKTLACYIEKIIVTFTTPLDKLEEDVCRLLNEDRLSRTSNSADGLCLHIINRKLMVGVHNGWSYVSDPVTAELSPHDASNVLLKRVGSKRGHKRSPSSSSLGHATTLVHKHRVELDGMVEDPSFCVVFMLIYDVAETTPNKDKRSSVKQNPYSVAIRWAAWCPMVNLNVQDHTVNLIGGPGANPEEMMLFHSQTTENIGSSASLSGLAGGTVSFSFFNELRDKENAGPIMADSSHLLNAPPHSARGTSRASEDGSGILQEVQVTGRPPAHPSSPRSFIQHGSVLDQSVDSVRSWRVATMVEPSTAPEAHQYGVPPLMGIGGSPPGTGYPGMYPGMYGSMPHMPVAMPFGTTPRGYMPVEVSTYMGWPAGSARVDMMPDLQEMPVVPIHAPVMAVAPGMHSGQALSRAAYAKLYSAGFQPVLDRLGEPAEVIDPVDMTNFVAAREDMDKLKANEIHVQFLAYARMAIFDIPGSNKQPSTVFFTFQFYRYPQVTTERLLLGSADGHLGNDPHAMPCLLQKLDKDGTVLKGLPGYMLKYMVDPAYMKPGEGRLFNQYLSQTALHVDVWDGDTLHLIGSCAVDLKNMCRQGREALQVTYELDIVAQDILDPEGPTLMDPLRDGMLPASVNQLVKGRLHLRLANVGHRSDTKTPKVDLLATTVPKPQLIVKGETGTAFLGGSLNSVNQQVKAALASAKIARALHVADTNHELAQILFSRRDQVKQEDTGRTGGVEVKRKQNRMEAIRTKQGSDNSTGMPITTKKKKVPTATLR